MAIHVKHMHGFSLGLFVIFNPQKTHPKSTYNNTKKYEGNKTALHIKSGRPISGPNFVSAHAREHIAM